MGHPLGSPHQEHGGWSAGLGHRRSNPTEDMHGPGWCKKERGTPSVPDVLVRNGSCDSGLAGLEERHTRLPPQAQPGYCHSIKTTVAYLYAVHPPIRRPFCVHNCCFGHRLAVLACTHCETAAAGGRAAGTRIATSTVTGRFIDLSLSINYNPMRFVQHRGGPQRSPEEGPWRRE